LLDELDELLLEELWPDCEELLELELRGALLVEEDRLPDLLTAVE
jgi:hypothetical protein